VQGSRGSWERKFVFPAASMPSSHKFAPSAIKNKRKREEVFHKAKKEKGQVKLQRRLANAKREADDPKAKQVRRQTCSAPSLDTPLTGFFHTQKIYRND
jgi:hypothetical protein